MTTMKYPYFEGQNAKFVILMESNGQPSFQQHETPLFKKVQCNKQPCFYVSQLKVFIRFITMNDPYIEGSPGL